MRSYIEAEIQGRFQGKVPYSFAGGRTRYATWAKDDNGEVTCSIYGNAIATFHPDNTVTIDAHGYHTASTVDAISYALEGAAQFGTVARAGGVIHYRGVPLIEPLTLDAAGKIVSDDPPTQLDTAELAGEVRRGKRGASVALGGKVIVRQVLWSDDGIREDMSDAQILEILLAGAR